MTVILSNPASPHAVPPMPDLVPCTTPSQKGHTPVRAAPGSVPPLVSDDKAPSCSTSPPPLIDGSPSYSDTTATLGCLPDLGSQFQFFFSTSPARSSPAVPHGSSLCDSIVAGIDFRRTPGKATTAPAQEHSPAAPSPSPCVRQSMVLQMLRCAADEHDEEEAAGCALGAVPPLHCVEEEDESNSSSNVAGDSDVELLTLASPVSPPALPDLVPAEWDEASPLRAEAMAAAAAAPAPGLPELIEAEPQMLPIPDLVSLSPEQAKKHMQQQMQQGGLDDLPPLTQPVQQLDLYRMSLVGHSRTSGVRYDQSFPTAMRTALTLQTSGLPVRPLQ